MKKTRPAFRRKFKIIAGIFLLTATILAGAFFAYVSDYYRADELALEVMAQGENISVQGNLTVLSPSYPTATALIFYPGAKVEAEAYLPLLDRIRQDGMCMKSRAATMPSLATTALRKGICPQPLPPRNSRSRPPWSSGSSWPGRTRQKRLAKGPAWGSVPCLYMPGPAFFAFRRLCRHRKAGPLRRKELKSSQSGKGVVPFPAQILYDQYHRPRPKNHARGENAMNTDKIYAEAIAGEYAPKDTSKVVALKKLDRKAKSRANIFAYTFGVSMTLVLGLGMCLSMQVVGPGGAVFTVLGILLGLLGIAGVGLNYPIYKKLLLADKEKYAFEIIQLAREISDSAE